MTATAGQWWSPPGGSEQTANERGVLEYAEHVADEHARPLMALSTPLAIEACTRYELRDLDGAKLIDLRSGGGVFPFGHRPTAMIDTLVEALHEVDIGDWQLPSPHRTALARDLTQTMTEGAWQWRFFVSGSEANEFALRTALMATGRDGVVALREGYHGHTGLAAAVTDPAHLAGKYPQMAVAVTLIASNDMSAVDAAVGDETAAVVVEPVQLTNGVRAIPAPVLERLRQRCDDSGAVLIFDEVKCGLNRTGPLWAHHAAGVVPDMLVAGKALSGGVYPVATCGVRQDGRNAALRQHRHDARSSYGGSHLGMMVGRSALRMLAEPANRSTYQRNGALLETLLTDALETVPGSGGTVRRAGMALEIDLYDDDLALFVAADLLHRGVVVPFPRSHRLVLLPPLTMPEQIMRTAVRHVAQSVAAGRAVLMTPGGGKDVRR